MQKIQGQRISENLKNRYKKKSFVFEKQKESQQDYTVVKKLESD